MTENTGPDDLDRDDQDAEPTKNAPDEGRPDLTALSDDEDEDEQ
ncbi:hypothetical protein [Jiangella aurantiaca]|nr:hypothetical protein [Jiangella aurantiaca]